MSLGAVRKLYLVFTLVSILNSGALANILITVTLDGNLGSTWKLSGSGLSTGVVNTQNWVFADNPFSTLNTSATDVGNMSIGGLALTNLFANSTNNLELLQIGGTTPVGTDLSTATGSFVNNVSNFFADGGLSQGEILLAPKAVFDFYGSLTIQQVPEVRHTGFILGAVTCSVMWIYVRRRRWHDTPQQQNLRRGC